jgi:hypothetical protein
MYANASRHEISPAYSCLLYALICAVPEYDNSKIQNELGLKFRDIAASVDDTVDFLIMNNFIPGLQVHKDAPQDWATTLTDADVGTAAASSSSSSKSSSKSRTK